MLELRNDYTIIIVTHNMQQAARVSDRTAFFTARPDETTGNRTGLLVEYDLTTDDLLQPRRQAHRGLHLRPLRLSRSRASRASPGRSGRRSGVRPARTSRTTRAVTVRSDGHRTVHADADDGRDGAPVDDAERRSVGSPPCSVGGRRTCWTPAPGPCAASGRATGCRPGLVWPARRARRRDGPTRVADPLGRVATGRRRLWVPVDVELARRAARSSRRRRGCPAYGGGHRVGSAARGSAARGSAGIGRGGEPRPVPVALGSRSPHAPAASASRSRRRSSRPARPRRVRRRPRHRAAVERRLRDAQGRRSTRPRCVAFDMAAYDDLVSIAELRGLRRRRRSWTGRACSGPRRCCRSLDENSWSPHGAGHAAGLAGRCGSAAGR